MLPLEARKQQMLTLHKAYMQTKNPLRKEGDFLLQRCRTAEMCFSGLPAALRRSVREFHGIRIVEDYGAPVPLPCILVLKQGSSF